jgi:hypothetical protein
LPDKKWRISAIFEAFIELNDSVIYVDSGLIQRNIN